MNKTLSLRRETARRPAIVFWKCSLYQWYIGATENARKENPARSKMQEWKGGTETHHHHHHNA